MIIRAGIAAYRSNHDQNQEQATQGQRAQSTISKFEHKHISPGGQSQSVQNGFHPIDSKPTYRQGVVKYAVFGDQDMRLEASVCRMAEQWPSNGRSRHDLKIEDGHFDELPCMDSCPGLGCRRTEFLVHHADEICVPTLK